MNLTTRTIVALILAGLTSTAMAGPVAKKGSFLDSLRAFINPIVIIDRRKR